MWSWLGRVGRRFFVLVSWIFDRLEEFFHVLKACRFSALVVVLGASILILEPQAQEVLGALAEDGGPWGWLGFHAAVVFWAFNAWYWARVVLSLAAKDLEPGISDAEGHDARKHRPILIFWRHHLPRLIGTAAPLAVAVALYAASQDGVFGEEATKHLRRNALAALVIAATFYTFVWNRRVLSKAAGGALSGMKTGRAAATLLAGGMEVTDQPEANTNPSFSNLPRVQRRNYWIALGLWLLLLLAAWFAPVEAGWRLGTPVVLLVTIALWIPTGSWLVIKSRRNDVPLITLTIIGGLIISLWNDNHEIRHLPAPPPERPGLDTAFEAWHKVAERKFGERPPLVIVATAGGGSRAAYWTATVLGTIRDQVEDGFDDQLFAMSGVSGGALGATIYRALVAQKAATGGLECDSRLNPNGKPVTTFAACGQSVAAHDFLGPTVAAFLLPDLLHRVWPFWFLYSFPDRAAALETSFEAAWHDSLNGKSDRFAKSYFDLWTEERPWPALILNGTSVASGKRIVTSNFRIGDHLIDASDFFTDWGYNVRLSTAANNAARFPYVEPAGTLRRAGRKDRIVDGGYFENFGAATARELLIALKKFSDKSGLRFLPVVIQISSDPDYGGPSDSGECPVPAKAKPPGEFASEAYAPLGAIFKTREARGVHAAAELKRWAESQEHGVYAHFCLSKLDGIADPPLGWALARASMATIKDNQLGTIANLAALKTVLGALQ